MGHILEMAQLLETAWNTNRPIAALSDTHGLRNIADAYAVQQEWTRLRQACGDRVVGRKIGLTSRAVQQQLGVEQPDFGSLWESRWFEAKGGMAEVDLSVFVQPRVEGEVAFLISKRLQGPGVTPQQVLDATEALAASMEIVDSRIENWRIKIFDTIADNASYGGFTLGPWTTVLLREDLANIEMTLRRNGEIVAVGSGSACLGHPAQAVAWLANALSDFGIGIEAGDIVLSGSWVPVQAPVKGDEFVLEVGYDRPLRVRFV